MHTAETSQYHMARRDACLSEQSEQMDVHETVLLEELAIWRASAGRGCWKMNLEGVSLL